MTDTPLDLDGPFSEAVGSLLIRCKIALVEEGIGPSGTDDGSDDDVLSDAVAVAGHLFDRHELWNYGLIGDEDHAADDCRDPLCISRRRSDRPSGR